MDWNDWKEVIIVTLCFTVLIAGLIWFSSSMKAKTLNSRFGTDYTTKEMLWLGDSLIVSDHLKIKE